MANSMIFKLTCVLVACMLVVSAPYAEAAGISCGFVAGKVGPCIVYLRGSGGPVPGNCCAGIKSLNAAASTTPDRQTACRCLKTVANGVSGLNYKLAESLPANCGVSIPYKISPSTDCSRVK
ncbi:Non-specific lipid-transfer protein [Thalictrum thalictroides]|uniref:Non-specific lipid-transfer protein n=1 Tax=Thalictrum thalictroides TaxID=46969 RepID=A0A7J6WYN1_THATH|nr:Non-specific lipid-transfer protein [Thalictrum thalictroides]